MTRQIKRSGDMGPRGSLELLWDDEGDIHVIVVDDENGAGACVEFCLSGSRSPRTHVALRRLFEAMEEDGRSRSSAR